MKYLKLFEHFGGNMYDQGKKLEGIYIGVRLLTDVIKKFKLKTWELEIVEKIFNNIPQFSHDGQADRQYVNKFINPEDMEEFVDSQVDVVAMGFNANQDYMKKCHEYIMRQLDYYLEDTSRIGYSHRDKSTGSWVVKHGQLPVLLEKLRKLLKITNKIYRK